MKSGKVCAVAPDGPPQLDGRDSLGVGCPHVAHEIAEAHRDVALHAQRVASVELVEVAVVVEVLRENFSVGNALQRRVPEKINLSFKSEIFDII